MTNLKSAAFQQFTKVHVAAYRLGGGQMLPWILGGSRTWPKVVDVWSDYANYQERTDREIPLGILSPV